MKTDQRHSQTSFAERFRWVLQQYPSSDGVPRTMASLARQITLQHPDASVTPAYLGQLRDGRRDNPSQRLVEHLAQALGCSVLLFYDLGKDAQAAALEELRQLREQATRYDAFMSSHAGRIAARMGELEAHSPQDLQAIESIVDALLRRDQEISSPDDHEDPEPA